MKSIDLGRSKIPLDQYASQGNAVLGIRGSGKSYTATKVAEQLLDAGVPIVAFDPIGIWRYLRVGVDGHEGYKVVVAGGEHGDIPLTAAGAAEIMRAAMRDGISIVFDLYDIALSKSDWRRVVEAAVKVLLYENKAHGLRHVFLEEAAEFCPQRLPPGDKESASVYSVIERLARMGGNAQLGYTLVNQRAEEVNKAVLELCDLLILHRQKGRNSLTALGKWLDVAMAKGDVAAEVPALANGEAFVWAAGDAPPVKTKIPAKRTFHPDRKATKEAAIAEAKRVDVTSFVSAMRENLAALTKEAEENDPKKLRAEIARLTREARAAAVTEPDPIALDKAWAQGHASGIRSAREGYLERFQQAIDGLVEMKGRIAADLEGPGSAPRPAPAQLGRDAHRAAQHQENVRARARMEDIPVAADAPVDGVNGPQKKILDALAWWEAVGVEAPTRIQVAVAARYVASGGAFQNPLGALRSSGLIEYPQAGTVRLTAQGRALADNPRSPPTTSELHSRVMGLLNGPQRKILDPLLVAYPDDMSREELADRAGYEAHGGAFQNPLGSLRSMGFIDYPSPGRVVARPVLFLP